jgi:hypothetical protein
MFTHRFLRSVGSRFDLAFCDSIGLLDQKWSLALPASSPFSQLLSGYFGIQESDRPERTPARLETL